MGRFILLARLAGRELRRHTGQAALLGLALCAAATGLMVGLTLHGQTPASYARTRAATRGPDVIATVFPAPGSTVSTSQRQALDTLRHDPAVARSNGPFPVAWTAFSAGPVRTSAEVQGRDPASTTVDQPRLTAGSWVRPGRAVLEQAFATALGARVGGTVSIGGRAFRVTGIAVTAAITPYPDVCFTGCILGSGALHSSSPGLVWLTRSDLLSLGTAAQPVALSVALALRDPARVARWASAHSEPDVPTAPVLVSWREIAGHDDKVVRNERTVFLLAGSLLSLLAVATVVVLVGGRMAAEARRIGTLKVMGATPAYAASILLVQYVAVAVVATAAGTAIAWGIEPALSTPSTGLLGSTGSSSIGWPAIVAVLGAVLGVTLVSAGPPALWAARRSTVAALAESARMPRRRPVLVALSARLPTSALIGLRIVARRPRRSLVTAVAVGIAVCGVVAVLLAQAKLNADRSHVAGALPDPDAVRLGHTLLLVSALLTAMSLLNLLFVAFTTAQESQTALAVAQALGASPAGTAAALATALAIPAALGAVVGLPGGIALFDALNHSPSAGPAPVAALVAVIPCTIALAVGLTEVTARLRRQRQPAELLRAEAT